MADSIDITGGGRRSAPARNVAAEAAQRVPDEVAEQLKPLFAHFLNQSAQHDTNTPCSTTAHERCA
jgi:hypothetical protein